MVVDLSVAAGSDRLADTVDYGALAVTATEVVAGERFHLLERLAERIASRVAATDARIEQVTVTVRKLRPPLAVDLASAGVRLSFHSEVGPAGRDRGRQRAFLSLGANLGDRQASLLAAVAALPDVVAVSPVYETEPVGGPPGQPPYLNVVVELATDRTPRELLAAAQEVEAAAGRVRGERFGPRTLDVDVLLVGDETVDEPDLTVPHPRMQARRFVMAPLADLAPELVPEGWETSAVGNVRRLGRLEADERHPPTLGGPEREETHQ